MSQPTMTPGDSVDSNGKRWVAALCDSRGRLIAGRDAQLNFHLFTSPEELFDNAYTAIAHAQGVKLSDIVKTPNENGDTQ